MECGFGGMEVNHIKEHILMICSHLERVDNINNNNPNF